MKQGMKRSLLVVLAWALVLAWVPAVAAAEVPVITTAEVLLIAAGQETLPVLATDAAVEQFLLGNADKQGRSFAASANNLQLIRKHVSSGGETNYLYQQLYRDVPVYGKYAKLRLDKQHRPAYIDNDLALELGSATLPTRSSLSEQQAVDALVRDVETTIGRSIDRTAVIAGKQAFYSEARQMLYPHQGEYRLVYQVTVSYVEPEPGSWTGFVDAASGTVLDKYGKRLALSKDNAVAGKGKGHTENYDNVRAYYDWDGSLDPDNPDRYYLLDVTRPMFRPEDDFDPGVIQTFYYEAATLELEDMLYLTWSDTDTFDNPEALDAHVQAGDVYAFFLDAYQWNSYDGQGGTVTSVVYYDHAQDNAFWVSGLDAIFYGVADQWDCIACSADIVAHEFAHGVIDNTARLEYRNQSGVLNESFADIFAAVFSRDGNPWLIGETTNNPIRNMADPEQYGQPMHMNDYEAFPLEIDNGGVHINSGIPNYAAYLLADGIDNSGLSLDGREALGHIAFGALFYLTPLDEFQDARVAFLLSALDYAQSLELDEADTIQLLDIVDGAWAAVGITDTYTSLNILHVVPPYEWYFLANVDEAEATAYVTVPVGYPKDDLRMQVISSYGTWAEPEVPVFDEKGEAVVRVTDGIREKEWTIKLVEMPALYYSGTTFTEAQANDGTISSAITIKLQGDRFTGSNGEDFVQTNKTHVENVPAGLTARAIRTSATEVRLQLDGKAQNHAAADSNDQMRVSFETEAFQNATYEEPVYYQVFWTIAEFDVAFTDPDPAPIFGGGGGIFIPPAPEAGEPEATDDGVVIRLDQLQPRTNSEGRRSLDVVLNEKHLTEGFALLAEQSDTPNVLRIPLDAAADVYEVTFPASAIRQGLDVAEDIRLAIETDNVTYEVPLAAIPAEQLAEGGQITVSIKRVAGETKQALITRTAESRMRLLGDAYDFEIVATQSGTDTAIHRFARPLTRSIAVEGRPANDVAVVRFDPASGRFAFVPATFTHVDGKSVATFSRSSNSIYAVVGYTPVFQDVAGHWANRDIEQLALRRVVSGVTPNTFQPNARVTRAQFAAMLVNGLDIGVPGAEVPNTGMPDTGTPNAETPETEMPVTGTPNDELPDTGIHFRDVAPSAWYAAAVAAGVDAGLFSGFSDGTFRPDETISREQMAAMLANAMAYAGFPGAATGNPETVLARFADRDAISDWAASSIAAAVQSGLLFGNTDGRFAPADPATRAEAAAILMRLLQALEQ